MNMAESEGFEPSIRFPVYTLSRGAPSATRPALPILVFCRFSTYVYAETWRTCALFRASCPSPFGLASLVQNRSRRFCQPLGQLSQFLFFVAFLHTCTLRHGARARYSGPPALHPSGSLRSCKIAPGDFVSHSVSFPEFYIVRAIAFVNVATPPTCAVWRVS